MTKTSTKFRFVVCLTTNGEDDLRPRQVYRAIPDARSERAGLLRVVDESGEDYLYPKGYFARIAIPPASRPGVQKMFVAGASRPPRRARKNVAVKDRN
jgi:hypothetical protein